MSRTRLAFLLLRNHGLYILLAFFITSQDTHRTVMDGFFVGLGIFAMALSFLFLLVKYQDVNHPTHPIPPRQMWVFPAITVLSCLLVLGTNSRQYYYQGGDVDPVAYLNKKTEYLGGYHLLQETGGYHLMAHTNMYRTLISKGPYVELPYPLAGYTVVSHIPSILEITEQKVVMNLPHTKRANECSISLLGGVVHLPFDEARVERYLKRLEGRWASDPVFDVTQELKTVFAPILKSVHEPLPEGTIYIDLDVTDGILGHLEEQYGFHIVGIPNRTPLLKCTIKYVGDPPANDSIQLLQGQEVRVSRIHELFPPRHKEED